MRIFLSVFFAVLTAAVCYILDTRSILPAPLGKLLAPQHGLWQNADPVNQDISSSLSFPSLTGKVDVYFDERLVPHVFAENDLDAIFVQGFLHAKFRLWQMELQTLSAAGRVSEIVGDVALNHDREFRRLGMVFGAENSLREMEANDTTKKECDAYTSGVNAYIETLTESKLPLEYKLLGYKPEKWSNMKTALFLKYMAYDLAAHENDFELTNAFSFFSKSDFNKLFPVYQDSMDPIIPKGTVFQQPKIQLQMPQIADSLYFGKDSIQVEELAKPDRDNGSNNWAISGAKTKSGAPILCNDPHLGLNLPSIWYEMQISTPSFNAYGATFPGAPYIIIGFNDSCAFGFTNGGRDVRDYYEIRFKDDSRNEYWFNNEWKKTTFRYERIKVAGKPDFIDTVAYTLFGPVMYDKSFSGKRAGNEKNYAVRWTAHDPSNELMLFNVLNRARNYADYSKAVLNLQTPGQNVVFACKNGDIAIRTQGDFPAKWKGQGDFIMPGTDSTFMWQGMIPMDETPYQYNPERGFVSSANQHPADSTYPYYLGRDYPAPRGLIINRMLASMQQVTPEDMMAMQTDNFNVFAEMARPILLKNIKEDLLNDSDKKYLGILKNWNLRNDADSKGATVFAFVWKSFFDTTFNDEYATMQGPVKKPFESTLLESLLKDSAYKFIDNISTTQLETLPDIVTAAFKKAVSDLSKSSLEDKLDWAKHKDTRISHLLKLPAFSRLHLPIGGGTHIINATKSDHGPSWRMIVSLTKETEAYAVYPGGQNGNPGSNYYDSFVDQWTTGKYYRLWMMKASDKTDKRIIGEMSFSNAL